MAGIGKAGAFHGREQVGSDAEAQDAEAAAASKEAAPETPEAQIVRGKGSAKARAAKADAAPESAASDTARRKKADATPAKAETKAPARAASSGALETSMLRQALEGRVGSRASTLPSGREALHGAATFAAERRKDPASGERFLAGAAHDQRSLLAEVRDAARRAGLSKSVGGSKSWSSPGGNVRANAGGKVGVNADGLHASGEAGARAGVQRTRSGAVEGRLGRAEGTVHGEVTAEAKSRGEAHVGPDGARAAGEASAFLGEKHGASGSVSNRLGRLSGHVSGETGLSANARGEATIDRHGARVRGATSGFAGARGEIGGGIDTKLGSAHARLTGETGINVRAAGEARLDKDGLHASGEAEARAGVKVEAQGQLRSKAVNANARAGYEANVYAKASGSASLDRNGLTARGEAEVGARIRVDVDADFRTAGVTIGGQRLDVNGKVHGEAEVSAYARVDADVAATPNPPRVVVVANAKAFAGAKASARGEIGLGDFVKVSGSAEAWAGAGAEAGIQAGYDDGKLRLGFNAGAAVGVGAGFSFAIEIDVKKIASSLLNVATGGLIDLEILLDRGDGLEPVQLANVQLLFPPQVESVATAGQIDVDPAQNRVRVEERKRERDAAEKHIRAALEQRFAGPLSQSGSN